MGIAAEIEILDIVQKLNFNAAILLAFKVTNYEYTSQVIFYNFTS